MFSARVGFDHVAARDERLRHVFLEVQLEIKRGLGEVLRFRGLGLGFGVES